MDLGCSWEQTFQLSLRIVRWNATAEFVEATQLFQYPLYVETLKIRMAKKAVELTICSMVLLLSVMGLTWFFSTRCYATNSENSHS